ncbi:MAG: OsmC family protein [Anaerolineae bacterium]|nr:OsmC family protein [Anaerolineae bacterium]
MTELNRGIDIESLLQFKNKVLEDPSLADRKPTVVAHWVGADESRVEHEGIVTHLGGENNLNPMKMLLGALAACDVDLIAMHCSFLGVKIESLSVEVTGDFNVQSYLGIPDRPGSGYKQITYVVHLNAPDATSDQIKYLKRLCEHSSPVGDSLAHAVSMKLEFVA